MATVIAVERHCLPNSSASNTYDCQSMPTPPYDSGIGAPKNPCAAAFLNISNGGSSFRSACSAVFAISFSAKSRNRSRNMVCSSLNLKSIIFSDLCGQSTQSGQQHAAFCEIHGECFALLCLQPCQLLFH